MIPTLMAMHYNPLEPRTTTSVLSFISCLGHASYHSNRKVTRAEAGPGLGKLLNTVSMVEWATIVGAPKIVSGRRVTEVLHHEVHSRVISSTRCTAKV